MAIKFKQILVDDADGTTWNVSVPDSVLLTSRGRAVSPLELFAEGSQVIAVEAGVFPQGEYEEHPNPFEKDENAEYPDDDASFPNPIKVKSFGPQFGVYQISYAQSGGIVFNPIPLLGDFLK